MKLHELPLNVSREAVESIPASHSLHFDLRIWPKGVVGGTELDDNTGNVNLSLFNVNLNWFVGNQNRYFTINDKEYWFAAISVQQIFLDYRNEEYAVVVQGKFVNKEKSLSFIKGRDMSGNYTPLKRGI